MMTGFAIFAAMLMLIAVAPINIEAAENAEQTATQATNENSCIALLVAYKLILKALDEPGWTDYEIEVLELARDVILDEAEAAGCLWVALSVDDSIQSTSVQMNGQHISPITEVVTGPVQSSSSSQSTCQLCASR